MNGSGSPLMMFLLKQNGIAPMGTARFYKPHAPKFYPEASLLLEYVV